MSLYNKSSINFQPSSAQANLKLEAVASVEPIKCDAIYHGLIARDDIRAAYNRLINAPDADPLPDRSVRSITLLSRPSNS